MNDERMEALSRQMRALDATMKALNDRLSKQDAILGFKDLVTKFAIFSIVRDYLSYWYPSDLGRLPESCRPGKIRDLEDISELTYELAHSRSAAQWPPEVEALLVQLETFFAQACARIGRLQSAAREGKVGDHRSVWRDFLVPDRAVHDADLGTHQDMVDAQERHAQAQGEMTVGVAVPRARAGESVPQPGR